MRLTWALAISAAIHLLALALAAHVLERAADGVTLAELDLSSIELSMPETEDATAAPAIAMPPPQEEIAAPRPEPVQSADFAPEVPVEEDPQAAPVPEWKKMPENLPSPEVEPPPPDAVQVEEAHEEEPEQPPEPADAAPQPKIDTPQPSAQSAPAPEHAAVEVSRPAELRNTIKPKYPAESRERGEEGKVLLELRVGAAGTVLEVKILNTCGFAALEAAAVKAARKMRFIPASEDGAAVESTVRLPFEFKLKKSR